MTTEVIAPPVADRPRAGNDPRMRRRLAAEAAARAAAGLPPLEEVAESSEAAVVETAAEVVAETTPEVAVDASTAEVAEVAVEAVQPQLTSGLQAALIFPEAAVAATPDSSFDSAEPAAAATDSDAVDVDEGSSEDDAEHSDETLEPESASADGRGRPRRPRTGGRPPKKRTPAVE
jgi:hypothetical protein